MSGREEEQKTTKGTRDEDEGETPEDQLINLQQRRCPPPNQCVCVCLQSKQTVFNIKYTFHSACWCCQSPLPRKHQSQPGLSVSLLTILLTSNLRSASISCPLGHAHVHFLFQAGLMAGPKRSVLQSKYKPRPGPGPGHRPPPGHWPPVPVPAGHQQN